jgi:hypothetical protein
LPLASRTATSLKMTGSWSCCEGSRIFRLYRVQLASKYHCDRLVYYESFDDVHKAIGREKQLKGWIRAKKVALIESKNSRWEDMAETWGAQMAFAGEAIKGP